MASYSQQLSNQPLGDDASSIRLALHSMIDSSDERLLKMMYVLANEYNVGQSTDAEPDLEELQRRTQNRINGKSCLVGWEQAKASIRKK